MGMRRNLEKTAQVYAEVKKRGIRVVIGGDYGFAWTPQGTNARDLQHFVNLFGYTPMEALICATRGGGELMRMGGELGQVREGYLADLLLVDGNPAQDVSIMADRNRFAMIMKDGAIHKDPRGVRPRGQDRGGVAAAGEQQERGARPLIGEVWIMLLRRLLLGAAFVGCAGASPPVPRRPSPRSLPAPATIRSASRLGARRPSTSSGRPSRRPTGSPWSTASSATPGESR